MAGMLVDERDVMMAEMKVFLLVAAMVGPRGLMMDGWKVEQTVASKADKSAA